MKTIRKKVFETNSSSSHSLCIEKCEKIPEKVIKTMKAYAEEGVLTLYGDDFGWEVAKYNSAYTKANYCRVDAQYNEENLEMLKEVIEEVTGLKVIIFEDCGGYIDHQSSGITVEEGVFDSKENLKDFIFNPDSVLYIDNDNY